MKVDGKIIPGYGVASGKGGDSRYKEGTLTLQYPHFKKRGLDLEPYYLGTVNVDIVPFCFEILTPKLFFANVDWSEFIDPENFYFFDVKAFYEGAVYEGLIYLPDPKTKMDHHQKPTVLELILPKIAELRYGQPIELEVDSKQIRIT